MATGSAYGKIIGKIKKCDLDISAPPCEKQLSHTQKYGISLLKSPPQVVRNAPSILDSPWASKHARHLHTWRMLIRPQYQNLEKLVPSCSQGAVKFKQFCGQNAASRNGGKHYLITHLLAAGRRSRTPLCHMSVSVVVSFAVGPPWGFGTCKVFLNYSHLEGCSS